MKKLVNSIFAAVLATFISAGASGTAPLPKGAQTTGSGTPLANRVMKQSDRPARSYVMSPWKNVLANPDAQPRHAATTAPPHKSPPPPLLAASADIPRLYGCVVFSGTWTSWDAPKGVYYLPRNDSEDYTLRVLDINAICGGVTKDGIYYSCYTMSFMDYTFVYYYGHDLETGSEVGYYYGSSERTVSMTLDETTGTIYALAANGSSEKLYLATVEFTGETPTITRIGDIPGSWNSIAADRSGQLYGIRFYTEPNGGMNVCTRSELYKINKETAAITLIGETGEKPQYQTDAVFDQNSGRMYWTVSRLDDTSVLAEVNLTTGKATPLYQFPDHAEITGLGIDAPPAYDKAPAAVTDAKAVFEKGSLSGTVSFKAPSTLFDGSPGQGDIKASVSVKGTELVSKQIKFSQSVSIALTVDEAGPYNFDITVSNSNGTSPKVTVETFIGHGTPVSPSPVLENNNGDMTLTWPSVTETVDGGYMDPAGVRYTVRRYPDNVVKAQSITATSFTEKITEPETVTAYYYTVTAEYAGLQSAPGESNSVMLGSVKPPWTANFGKDTDHFTIVDSNGDYNTWSRQEAWVSGIGGYYMRINTYYTEDTDDWLLTPPVKLESGKAYKLKFLVITSTQNEEILEVKMGQGTDVASLTSTVLEPTTLLEGKGREIERRFHVGANGVYTIGFHCTSPAERFYIAVTDISISEPFSLEVPDAVSSLSASAGASGALNATVSMNAPSTSINGNPLTLDRIEVRRDGTTVKTFHAPAPGAALSFTDPVGSEGTYTYTAQAFNSDGESDEVSTSVYVGIGIAKSPQNVRFTRTDKTGEVALSWDPVTENTQGTPLGPECITYNIYTTNGYRNEELVKGVTGCEYTYQAVEEGKQAFMQYVVAPVTKNGESIGTVSNLEVVGTPYNGIHETGELNHAWSTAGTGAMWVVTNPDELGIQAQDGDNRIFALSGNYIGDGGTLTSGMISLEGLTKPGITYYIYSMGSDDGNEMSVYATDLSTGVKNKVSHVVGHDLSEYHTWNKVMISLDDYAGKTISITFEGELKSFTLLLIDNISVGELLDHDLAVAATQAPKRAMAGSDFTVTASIRNEGMTEATGYITQLLAGDEVIASREGVALGSNKKTNVRFKINMSIFAEQPMNLTARVVYDPDQNSGNNCGQTLSVDPTVSRLPAPENLTATQSGDDVGLSWTEPDYAGGAAMPITDNFENAESWAHEYDGWQFVDMDQSEVGCIVGFTTPGVDYSITKSSFFIFDNSDEGADETFATHSGSKFLVSLYRWDNKQVDDWAVSPLLDGTAQSIYFFAKSYDPQYPETIEVYYTTSDADEFNVDDYTLCATYEKISGKFEEYSADLPEGATHFAIRNCGTAAFVLMVDDVTFVPESPRTEVVLKGYDVYRDGVKINTAPVTATEFTDPGGAANPLCRYTVSALYDLGMSAPSNSAGITDSGLDTTPDSGIRVAVRDRNIIITGAGGHHTAICTADGRSVHNGVAPSTLKVSVAPGVYVVKAADRIVKVIVR